MSAFFGLFIVVVALLFILRLQMDSYLVSTNIARTEHARAKDEHPTHPLAQMSEEDFLELFDFVRRKRILPYMALFAGIGLGGSAVVLTIFSMIYVNFYPGPWVWGLMTLFGITAWWAASVGLTLLVYMRQRFAALEKAQKSAEWRAFRAETEEA